LPWQFIFATHNANFPVLGDAETITTCSATDDEITVAVGNIDEKACQGKVINIMEGGPEAFDVARLSTKSGNHRPTEPWVVCKNQDLCMSFQTTRQASGVSVRALSFVEKRFGCSWLNSRRQIRTSSDNERPYVFAPA
jgi:hypothetical protein